MNSDKNKINPPDENTGEEVYKSDTNFSLRYMRWLLRLVGIWPLVALRPIPIEYVLSKLIVLPLVTMLLLSLTIPLCYYAITRPLSRYEIVVLLPPITFQVGNILKYFAMIMRAGSLKICVGHMESDWQRIDNSEERSIMSRYVGFSHAISIACIFFMSTGAFSYSLIMPLLSGNTLNEMNETLRPRPFPGTEIFFDVQADVVYEIVFTINFISALLHYIVTTTMCNLAIVFVSHACGQIQIVRSNFGNFVDGIDENDSITNSLTKQIGFIIRRHVRLLKFAMNIENALNEMILLEVVATTLVICFLEYLILMTMEGIESSSLGIATYIMLIVSFAFNLFLYCQFGEVLRGECEKIGKKAYLTDWIKLPGKTRLTLIMIISISNIPCRLTAGRIMDLSIINFASVMKSSFAYFNMMRTTA